MLSWKTYNDQAHRQGHLHSSLPKTGLCKSWNEPVLEQPGDIFNRATNLCVDGEGWAKIVLASLQNCKGSDAFSRWIQPVNVWPIYWVQVLSVLCSHREQLITTGAGQTLLTYCMQKWLNLNWDGMRRQNGTYAWCQIWVKWLNSTIKQLTDSCLERQRMWSFSQ